ncbi:GNAT family N-acetyltransferase [Mycoplasmatota bacterium]|nr:GNAT family N-acetyltransferase [Mycoplasmatota bacterium]
MLISIKRITKENYSEFTKLIEHRRTKKESKDLTYYDNNDMKQFMEQYHVLDSDTFFIYAACMDNQFVGYINAIIIPKPDPRKGLLYIDELWTIPEYRRHGVAKLLMKEVFKLAKQLDLWRVRLYVGVDNKIARNYYQKMGFNETDHCLTCELNVSDIII